MQLSHSLQLSQFSSVFSLHFPRKMQNANCSYCCIVIAWNLPHLNILITWVNRDELIEILNLFSIVDFPQELIFHNCILFVNVVHFTVTCYWPHDPMWKLQTYDMYIDHNTLCFACNCNCNNWPCEFYEKYYWNRIMLTGPEPLCYYAN